ncbi:zinc-binding metallopeptidase family protein [Novosphingobium rosa]|uniref:zinc-binding metallopeptidase family protein n=1 Tax=Novosphingobium rosa TaxID=76978 RepID=UPI0008296E4C|nr:putative zinc-binding peptidase [Novosphingobium rosa]
MQLFQCQSCGQVLYFENTACVKCGHRLGYLPDRGRMSAVEPDGAEWIALANPQTRYRFCANWEQNACNWMVDAAQDQPFCIACQHNRTIPDLSLPDNRANWQKIEEAKRRLFYTLIKLRLPMPTVASGDPEPLVFDFPASANGEKVMTGHDNGVITIALEEADDVARESARASMGELYRTLLGHFRHEVGHYYWDRLVRDGGELESFRALFGDERLDYGEALQRHYDQGAPAGWQQEFVSAYATMHPWEDWAETWAHYLHIIDTLEMAGAFGIRIEPRIDHDPELETEIAFDPHQDVPVERLIDAWLPLTYAVNCLNRSMGQGDLYPFVIPPRVVEKMAYIHRLIHARAAIPVLG